MYYVNYTIIELNPLNDLFMISTWSLSKYKNIHVYICSRNMREVWLAERDLADADPAGVRPRPVTMHFVRDAARDDGRNNLPTANEVAAVFVGEGGRPPRDINLVIYDTNPINPQHRMQTIPAG